MLGEPSVSRAAGSGSGLVTAERKLLHVSQDWDRGREIFILRPEQ